MGSILDVLGANYPNNITKELKKKIEHKSIKKGTLLQSKGDTLLKGFYVKSGLLRSYVIDEKGKEHIFMFAPEDWIMSDIESHSNNAPAELFIDALEDSEVEILDRKLLHIFLQTPPEVVNANIEKLVRRVGVLQRRVLMLMSASAQQRYEHFLETYPQIVQRVPQRMIASYLGMTPEALSKIRGLMARSK